MKPIKCNDCGENMGVIVHTEDGTFLKCKCGNWDVLPAKGKARARRIKEIKTKGRMLKKMVCPLCGEKLAAGENRNYETLSEHCFDPNDETERMRRTFVCNNPKCEAHGTGYWGYNGGRYSKSVRGIPDLSIYAIDKADKAKYNRNGLYIGERK